MSTYPNTFHTYICRTVDLALANVRVTVGLLPDAVRKQALHALSYALGLDAAWPTTRELLWVMAPKMEQAGHRTDWMPYLEQGITAGERLGDWPAVAEYQLQLGMLYRMISQFEPAKAWLSRSVANFAQGADGPNQARALNELAWVEHLQHRYAEATAHAEQALGLAPADHPECGMSYRVLGMIAIAQRKWEEAELLHHKAFVIFQTSDDMRRAAWSLQNLGYALRGQTRFDEAIIYFQKAAEILGQASDWYHWAIVQMNLGIVFSLSRQPKQAVVCYQQAQLVFEKTHAKLFLGKGWLNLGIEFLNLQKHLQAEQAFRQSAHIFQELGDDPERLNVLDGLGMALLAQEQYHEASKVLEQALAELPKIREAPNYDYLFSSLSKHLDEAKKGQRKSIGFSSG